MRSFAIYIALLSLSFGLAQLSSNKASNQINNALDDFFGAGGTTTVSPEQIAAVDTRIFVYQADPAVSRQVHEQLADSLIAGGSMPAESRVQLLDGLAQITLEQQQQFVDAVFASEGFKANNLVDVIAMNIIASYFILLELEQTTTEQDLAVRDLFKVAFAKTPAITQLGNAEKQNLTESLMLAFMFTANDLEQAQAGTPGYTMPVLKDAAKRTLLSFGLHPKLLTLGAAGLEMTAELKAVSNQIETGSLTFEQAFPDVVADYQALGQGANPVIPAVTDSTSAQTTNPRPIASQPGQPEPVSPLAPANNPLAPSNPLAPANPLVPTPVIDPFIGTFSDGNLSLKLTKQSEIYTGELSFNGQIFPVKASSSTGQTLTGSFSSADSSFSFSASLEGSALIFESDGNRFSLQKTE